MTVDKVRYPGSGCMVEFMQGNTPTLALVLEEQGGRLRLYLRNGREMPLATSRLLPWAGPAFSAGMSRAAMDAALGERLALRESLAAEVNLTELWELAQGEVEKASAAWLAALVWKTPTIDHEAALGHALLAGKTLFRFSPPDFEIFPREIMEARMAEAERQHEREAVLHAGSDFFRRLWDIHCHRRGGLSQNEIPSGDLAPRLRELLFAAMAEQDTPDIETFWKALTRGLPESPQLPLYLAVAWGLVPEHYNTLLDRAGFERGEGWIKEFTADCSAFREDTLRAMDDPAIFPSLPDEAVFLSIDPPGTLDRDDAFSIQPLADGGFHIRVALACPGLCWPFGSGLDKAVLRRASSLYLPEGDEHMLPAAIGWGLFGLDADKERPAFVADIRLDASGAPVRVEPLLARVRLAANLVLPDVEALLVEATSHDLGGARSAADASANPAAPHARALRDAYTLATLLQKRRIAEGAVITERPDPEIILEGTGSRVDVRIETPPPCYRAQLVVGELMVLANACLASWGGERNIPLLYRTQDVGLPREFAGVWSAPQDISRVVRALPPACLETQPRRHAGLGLSAYATMSSPLRRYVDLVNQGQCLQTLRTGHSRYDAGELAALLPLVAARSDAVAHIQRLRPRYWKLLFFRQQGDKKWWDAVVTEENEAFVSIALPWAQFMARGPRSLFDEKLRPGQAIMVRFGKVVPLTGEIRILETCEA